MANRPAVLEISALAALKLTDALLSAPYYDGKLDLPTALALPEMRERKKEVAAGRG